MDLVKLGVNGHSWEGFEKDWREQCERYEEDLEDYAGAVFPVFKSLIEDPSSVAGVYALHDGERYLAVCQLNCASLPGYTGRVLRVRYLTVAPTYDFDDHKIDEYASVLIGTLLGILEISDSDDMQSDHVKFHLRSPAERSLFSAFGAGLDRADVYKSVKMTGAWLYVTK